MSQTISKHIGEGFGRGELYAALNYDATDVFGGMKIKALMLNSTGRISFLDATSYIYSSATTVLDLVSTTINITGAITAGGQLSTAYPIASTSALTAAISVTATQASATPGTIRAIHGKETTHSSMTSGMLVGVRGEVVLDGNVTNVHLCGVQGKITTGANTVNHATAYIAAVFGQLDLSSGSLTTGRIAGVAADIFGCTTEGRVYSYLNGMYVEHAGGATINSFFRGFGKTTYIFDFQSNLDDTMKTTGSVTTDDGWLCIQVDGVKRFIGLGSDHTP